MNIFAFSGRLTKDPELKTIHRKKDNKEVFVCNFKLAVDNEFPYNKDETSFFDCTAFGSTAKFICDSFLKGHKLLIRGVAKSEVYEKNNEKRYAVRFIVNYLEYAGSPDKLKKAIEKEEADNKNLEIANTVIEENEFMPIDENSDFAF